MKRIFAMMVAFCMIFAVGCATAENADEKENLSQNTDVTDKSETTEDEAGNDESGEPIDETDEEAEKADMSVYERFYNFIKEKGTADGDDFIYQEKTAGSTFTMVAMPDGTMVWGSESEKALTVLYLEDGAQQFRTECTATISGGSYTGEATVSTLDPTAISELDDFVTNAPAAMYDSLQQIQTLYVKNIITMANAALMHEGIMAADITE